MSEKESKVTLATGAALERERIADKMRERIWELSKDGYVISPELDFLKGWVNYLSYPHRRNCDLPPYACPDCVEEESKQE